jgi:hypothetical protein
MRLRYAGSCRVCGAALAAREEAIYERSTKAVRCVSHVLDDCHDREPEDSSGGPLLLAEGDQPADGRVQDPGNPPAAAAVEAGVAGASARREFERRRAKREERIRSNHPKLGGLILALSDDPQSTSAWNTGAIGEERLGRGLDALASDSVRLLHDRRIPRSRANIDHIAVTASGVYVIDAKKYRGRPQLKVEGGILRPRVERLLVASRDCTKLVDGVLKQVEVVRGIVGDVVPVHGVLCFIGADWPLIGGSFTTRDVQVLWPKKLYPKLQEIGGLSESDVAMTHRRLAAHLLPA